MLSSRDLVGGYDWLWMELLPFLTPSSMATLNAKTKRTQRKHKWLKPVTTLGEPFLQDYVAELAFQLAADALGQAKEPRQLFRDNEYQVTLVSLIKRKLIGISRVNLSPVVLGSEEEAELVQLANNIVSYCEHVGGSPIFRPQIAGYGCLGPEEADIAIENRLVEVKAVSRRLRSKDIRQVFVYFALQSVDRKASGRWTELTILNPKLGVHTPLNVDDLMYELSGGRRAVAIFREFLDHFERREFQSI